MSNKLPDIQLTEPEIKMAIPRVGIENLRLPLQIQLKDSVLPSNIVADCTLTSNIGSNTKGISMSRLALFLQDFLVGSNKYLKQSRMKDLLIALARKLESTNAMLQLNFELQTQRRSILSDYIFPIFTPATFRATLDDGIFEFYQGLTIQYISYCPCSAELCKDLAEHGSKGFPHNQRSFAKVLCNTTNNRVYLEEIMNTICRTVKTIPYPIIKRTDEQEIARVGADSPMFVEDSIRAISKALDSDKRINDWWVKCVHHESIHFHNAIAENWKTNSNLRKETL